MRRPAIPGSLSGLFLPHESRIYLSLSGNWFLYEIATMRQGWKGKAPQERKKRHDYLNRKGRPGILKKRMASIPIPS